MTKPGWLKVARAGLEFLNLARAQVKQECPYENCPLKLNVKAVEASVEISQDEKIKRQKELYKRNHSNG